MVLVLQKFYFCVSFNHLVQKNSGRSLRFRRDASGTRRKRGAEKMDDVLTVRKTSSSSECQTFWKTWAGLNTQVMCELVPHIMMEERRRMKVQFSHSCACRHSSENTEEEQHQQSAGRCEEQPRGDSLVQLLHPNHFILLLSQRNIEI